MKKISMTFLFLMGLLVITGCAETSGIEDDIHETLTAAVEAEKGVDELQVSLNEHSSNEKILYDEMIELPLANQDKLPDIVSKAEVELKASENIITEIQTKLDASKQHIDELDKMKSELNSEEKQSLFNELDKQMNDRMDHLQTYYDTYLMTIESSQTLYQLFLKEGFQTTKVYDMIEEVNDLYDELSSVNEQINASTQEVNKLKTQFYELINE